MPGANWKFRTIQLYSVISFKGLPNTRYPYLWAFIFGDDWFTRTVYTISSARNGGEIDILSYDAYRDDKSQSICPIIKQNIKIYKLKIGLYTTPN